MTSPDIEVIAAAQAAAEAGENGRRLAASGRPGHGSPVPIAEPLAGASTGKSTEAGVMAGLGYAVPPGVSESQVASYVMPNYAPDAVAGFGFVAGRQEAPARRSVTDLGDGRLFIDGSSSPAGDAFMVMSPSAPRLSLWSRLTARFRK